MLELIKKTRSYRRFDHSRKLDDAFLTELVDAARLAQSAANAQPLRYVTVNCPEYVDKIFPHLRWAGKLKDWDGPVEAERPVAYIAVYGDSEAKPSSFAQVDSGIAMQNICLTAMSRGIGSCMFGSIIKGEINQILGVTDERYSLLWVIALGYPVENVVLVDNTGDLSYYRDADGNHYVPKHRHDEVLLGRF